MLGDLDHKFTNPSMPLTLRIAGPRSRVVRSPPYTWMADPPEGWGLSSVDVKMGEEVEEDFEEYE